MKTIKTIIAAILLIVFFPAYLYSQDIPADSSDLHIYTRQQTDSLLKKRPERLNGYWPNQSGYLSKVEENGKERIDTTFTIEQIKIPSAGLMINGWLYLPEGNGKCPLIVLTNGGGNITKNIRSFSDWLAPILAHCGIAAFVHDKRGTGESEGDYVKTTYNDYITDAGNCAVFLSKHKRINADMIGVAGASEGGRIAVLAASRYHEVKFAISYAGTVVSTVDDRINAQKGWLKSLGLPDSSFDAILGIHEESIRAWASGDSSGFRKVNEKIYKMRLIYGKDAIPFTKEEMDTIPDLAVLLPTWYSLPNDYLTELGHFNKKWLAIFGEADQVVPSQESIKNILYYMKVSGNKDYQIAIIPDCGHAPVNIKTKRMVRLDNIIINWVNDNITM